MFATRPNIIIYFNEQVCRCVSFSYTGGKQVLQTLLWLSKIRGKMPPSSGQRCEWHDQTDEYLFPLESTADLFRCWFHSVFICVKNINKIANIWISTEETVLSNVLFWKLSNCSQILQHRNCDETWFWLWKCKSHLLRIRLYRGMTLNKQDRMNKFIL